MAVLTRQKFGKLTVISEYIKDKEHWCLCQCDCGSPPVLKLASNLKKGLTKSCGCLKKEMTQKRRADLSKKKFGLLTPIDINEELSNKNKRVYWNCICDCGNSLAVAANKLISGRT